MKTVIFGIDPGLKGGIAVFFEGRYEFLFPMPIKVGGHEIDGYRLFVAISKIRRWLKMQTSEKLQFKGYIEQVNAMPGQGVCSMFTFGDGYGVIKNVLDLHMQYDFVTPIMWKKTVLCDYDWKQSVPKLVLPKDISNDEIKRLKREHNKLKTEAKKRGKEVAILFIHEKYPYVDLKYGSKVDKDGLADACCIALYGAIKENLKINIDNI